MFVTFTDDITMEVCCKSCPNFINYLFCLYRSGSTVRYCINRSRLMRSTHQRFAVIKYRLCYKTCSSHIQTTSNCKIFDFNIFKANMIIYILSWVYIVSPWISHIIVTMATKYTWLSPSFTRNNWCYISLVTAQLIFAIWR